MLTPNLITYNLKREIKIIFYDVCLKFYKEDGKESIGADSPKEVPWSLF